LEKEKKEMEKESKVSKYLSEICTYMQSIDEASCHMGEKYLYMLRK
jgi:hypothetical protein